MNYHDGLDSIEAPVYNCTLWRSFFFAFVLVRYFMGIEIRIDFPKRSKCSLVL